MAQYFLPIEIDKYIVLDQDLLQFPIQIFTGLAFLFYDLTLYCSSSRLDRSGEASADGRGKVSTFSKDDEVSSSNLTYCTNVVTISIFVRRHIFFIDYYSVLSMNVISSQYRFLYVTQSLSCHSLEDSLILIIIILSFPSKL